MPKQTVFGSCHCKKVTFEAKVDLSRGTSKCNCTFCLKNRYWGIHDPRSEFKLLSGADSLRSYSHKTQDVDFDPAKDLDVYENHLPFCKTCGTHSFNMGNLPELGGQYASVNVACLENVDFKALMQAPIEFMNGKDNDWFSKPAFTAHL